VRAAHKKQIGSIVATLSALTGMEVKISGQDPEALRRGIAEWM